jgi:hypothetical protein
VAPQLGQALYLGNAPPHGLAQRLARGWGPHRFVQDFRGVLVDISGLRLAPLDAQGMRRVLGNHLMGMLEMPFLDEYPDDYCDPPRSSSTTTPSGGKAEGGPDDTNLWAVTRSQPGRTPVAAAPEGGGEGEDMDTSEESDDEASHDASERNNEPGRTPVVAAAAAPEGGGESEDMDTSEESDDDESDDEELTPHETGWGVPTPARLQFHNDGAAASVEPPPPPSSIYKGTSGAKKLEVGALDVAVGRIEARGCHR